MLDIQYIKDNTIRDTHFLELRCYECDVVHSSPRIEEYKWQDLDYMILIYLLLQAGMKDWEVEEEGLLCDMCKTDYMEIAKLEQERLDEEEWTKIKPEESTNITD